jgi:hypothetical protein
VRSDEQWPRAVRDTDLTAIIRWMEHATGADFAESKVNRAIDLAAQMRAFDPVCVYLKALRYTSSQMVRRVYGRIGSEAKRPSHGRAAAARPRAGCDVGSDRRERKAEPEETRETTRGERTNEKKPRKPQLRGAQRQNRASDTRIFKRRVGGREGA